MRLLSLFKRKLVVQFSLIVVGSMLAMVLIAQGVVQLIYQESLEKQVRESETVALSLVGGNINGQVRPYLLYLYSAATDPALLKSARLAEDAYGPSAYGISAIREQLMNRILHAAPITTMGVIYEDGNCVRYEKVEPQIVRSRLWQQEYRQDRIELVARTRAARLPVVSFEPETMARTYVSVPLIGDRLAKADTFAIVTMCLDFSFLQSTFAQVDGEGAQHYLTDQDGLIIMCADPGRIGQRIDSLSDPDLVMQEATINRQNWKVYKQIDRSGMMGDLNRKLQLVNVVYLALAAALVLVVVMTLNHMLLPVRELVHAMGDADGEKWVRVPIKGQHELWRLAGHFNSMMDRLDSANRATKQYYQQTLMAERRKRQAEIEMLESHINAHFMFNTLNAINMQALNSGNRNVSMSIKRLANIMRYAFNRRLSNVRLYQEASWVEQYLFMQKERLGDRFSYDVSIDDDVADWPFRKMMLQPFVENAIIHGLGQVEEAVLLLAAHAQGEKLAVTISDNGCGMDEGILSRIRRILIAPQDVGEGGIGLPNVAERIYAFFGPDARIAVGSAPGRGTTFTLILPWPQDIDRTNGQLDEEDEDDEIY